MAKRETTVGRRLIAEALRDAGIDTIFTVAGGHFLPTYHEIGQLDSPTIVTARHEQGAGYMASGYALVTNRPGVVLSGAPGPGATNLVTAVANAYADSIPLLVLSAQVDRRYVHRNILQYCDNVSLFDPFCKSSVQAVSVDEVPNLIATAMQLAVSGRPGPVHIALPQNLQAESAFDGSPIPIAPPSTLTPSDESIEAVVAAIGRASRPAILAGHGVIRAGASKALETVAEALGAPVATSRSGIGSIDTANPRSVGMLGFYGTEAARNALAEADLVVVVGCALGEQTTFGWRSTLFADNAEIVHCDVDPQQINRIYSADFGVAADAATFLDSLSNRLETRPPWFHQTPERTTPQNDEAKGLSAATVLRSLNDHAPADAVFSADIGNHRLWVCEQLDITHSDRLLQSCEFDAMGFSLPAAIGAASVLSNTKVISISGDGGFVHTMGELTVAQELGLPVVAVVFVDGALGILKHQAEEMYGEDHFVRLAPIDFAAVGTAFGVPSRTISKADEVESAVEWAMSSTKPVLLAFEIDPDEVFPPLRTKIDQRKIDLLGDE